MLGSLKYYNFDTFFEIKNKKYVYKENIIWYNLNNFIEVIYHNTNLRGVVLIGKKIEEKFKK